MLSKINLFVLFSTYSFSIHAQSFTVSNSQTATALANRLVGTGVTVSGATLTCNSLANGIFVNINPSPTQSLSIDSGIVLSTGKVLTVGADTGIAFSAAINASSFLGSVTSDAELTSLAGASALQRDVCKLEFSFVPKGDSVYLDYTYASEEYPDYNCSNFNDVFGIFVSPTSGAFSNYSKVPGTGLNVSINSINDSTCCNNATLPNTNFTTYCSSLGAGAPFKNLYVSNSVPNHIVYDGMTKLLKVRIPVSPNIAHNMKIAITDITDGFFDSGLFLKARSLISLPLIEITSKTGTNGSSAAPLTLIEGCANGIVNFTRSNTTSNLTVNVGFSGTAVAADHNGASSFVIPSGSSTFSYNIQALLDGLTESTETLKLTFNCPVYNYTDTVLFFIKDFGSGINVFNATNSATICDGNQVALNYSSTGPGYTFLWTPGTNLSCTSCTNTVYTANNGNTFTTEIVNLRISLPGCTAIDTPITINIQPKPVIAMSPLVVCKGDSLTIFPTIIPAGTYSYTWSPGTFLSATNILNPKAWPPSTQTLKLIVSTSGGCKDSVSVPINVSNIRAEIDSIIKGNASCGSNNGTLNFFVKNPPINPPYQYSINGGVTYSPVSSYAGLSPGTYNVSIKNQSNCKFDTTITITGGTGAPSATITKVNTTCGLNNGSAILTSKSGFGPFTYAWKLGATTISTDTFISNKASGSYTFVITDVNGCFSQQTVVISASTPLTIGFSTTNQSCGLNNGSIIATPGGGTNPYTFSWSNGVTGTNTITGLSSGFYKLTVTDLNNCQRIDSGFIQSFPALVGSKTITNPACGSVNGSVQANVVSGGTPPFVYSFSNGTTSPTTTATSWSISGLTGGKYTFTITDSKGCTYIDSASLNSSLSLSVSLTTVNLSCGSSNGSISLSILSGTPSYSFIWNDGSSTQNRTGLNVGAYSVTITDGAGCTATQSTTVSTNSNPSLTLVKVDALCGQNNGTVFTIISGAKAPILYAWSNGSSSNFITGLGSGTYTLTITDSFGCTKTASATIIATPAANFNSTIIQPKCGLNNGSISLTNISGVNPIKILWIGGDTTASRVNLAPGSYSVIITDSNKCTKTQTFVLNSSTKPIIQGLISHAVCTLTTGNIITTVIGGKPVFKYLWNNGDTISNIINKPIGTYKVTVIDGDSCIDTSSFTILSKPGPVYTDSIYKSRCGFSNGKIHLFSLAGSFPWTYNWVAKGFPLNTSVLTNSNFQEFLAGDIYYLTITDINGCVVFDTFDLRTNGPIAPNGLPHTIVRPTCKDSNGSVTITALFGTPPYIINWSNGDKGFTADSLKHGNVGVSIVDSLGCIFQDSIYVKNNTPMSDSFIAIQPRCDSMNGKITIYPFGGAPPYKIYWQSIVFDSTFTIDSLGPGLYSFRLIDSLGCIFDSFVDLQYNHKPVVSHTDTFETCNACNGKIYLKIDSAILPIKVFWNGILGDTFKLNICAPSTISVMVEDSQKCQSTTIIINMGEIPLVVPIYAKHQPPCGNNLGKIEITNFIAVDTIIWSNGKTGSPFFIDSLPPGIYTVTIIDLNGCVFTHKDTLTYTSPPTMTYVKKRPNCSLNDGSVTASVATTEGLKSFNWLINGVYTDTALKINNVPPGTIIFTAVDIHDCIRRDTFTLLDSAGPTYYFTKNDALCFNGTGKIKATPSSGTPPFSYLWNTFTTADSIIGLNNAKYYLTMTDNRGCQKIDSIIVEFKPKPEISLLSSNSKCGLTNGLINSSISFGTPSFSYKWSNGDTTKNLSGLTSGTFTLIVTDSFKCTDTLAASVIAQPAVSISLSKTNAFCDLNNGTGVATILTGKPPYIYNWSTSVSTLNVSGLDTGKYIFQVIDSNLCVAKDSFYITRFTKPVISQTITNDNCTYSIGAISTSVSGGKPPLTYLWNAGLGSNPNLINLPAGTYALSVTDSMGCQTSKLTNLTDTAGPLVNFAYTLSTCGVLNGNIVANVISIQNPFTYTWNSVSGSNIKNGINGGKYVVKVTDKRGCFKIDTAILDTVKVLTNSLNFKQASCNINNGYIKVKASGGSTPYIYNWSHAAVNSDSISNLSPGTYKVTIIDNKGCTKTDSLVIVQIGQPTVSFNKTSSKCKNPNGSITAILGNTSGSYSFLWSNSVALPTISGLIPGSYTLTASDGAGCFVSATTTLSSIGLDSANLKIKLPVCGLSNGNIKANPINAVSAPTYMWSTTSSSDSIFGLNSGTYFVTISDSLCSLIKQATTVNQISPSISLTSVSASCGINNGRAISTTINGTSPFNYNWSNSSSAVSLFNVDSGLYTLTITDANNCKDTAAILVNRIKTLAASFVPTKSTCGKPNGAIATSTTGGVGPLTYTWSNGLSNAPNHTNLLPGNYTLTLTDNNGNCTITYSVTIDDFKKPEIDSNIVQPVCDNPNGKITITIRDGSPPFIYNWNTGAVSKDLNNILPGFYKLTVTDAIGCTDSSTMILTNSPTPSVTVTVDTSTCGQANGRMTVQCPRCISPTFTWSNSVVDDTIINLGAGLYTVTVNDQRGCVIIQSRLLPTTTIPEITLTAVNAFCNGANGSINTFITNGSSPFIYTWSNGANSSNISSLTSGNYTLTVVDRKLCKDTASIYVSQDPNIVSASLVKTHLTCFQNSSGKVVINPNGGVAPYQFKIFSGVYGASNSFNNLSSGQTSFTILDSRGCVFSDTFSLFEPALFKVNLLSLKNVSCFNSSTGQIELIGSGGTNPYNYVWETLVQIGSTATNLKAGSYKTIATDFNGCKDSIINSISQPTDILISLSKSPNPCNGQSIGSINSTVFGGTIPYTYLWSTGSTDAKVENLKGSLLGLKYSLTVTDKNNCQKTILDSLVDPAILNLVGIIASPTLCSGSSDGKIAVNSSGGNGSHLVSIDSGKSYDYKYQFDNLPARKYYIFVKDANGCIVSGLDSVTSLPLLSIKAYPHDTTISLDNSVQLTYNVVEGQASWIQSTLWSSSEGLNCVDCISPIANPYIDKQYVVEVKYHSDCYAYDTVQIKVIDTSNLYVPNAFTPVSGLTKYSENETFRVYSKNLVEAHLQIFNRWGEKVFESKDAHLKGWDGTFKGVDALAGVYIYHLDATYLNGKIRTKKGDVTLIR